MKFQPGDHVSFVNDIGGGIIQSVSKNGNYLVAIEDGFEISCSEKELALVKQAEDKDHLLQSVKAPEIVAELPAVKKFQTPLNEITFVSVPEAENQVFTGNISFYLVNNTFYQAYFVLSYVLDKKHYPVASKEILPGMEIMLATFSRPEMTLWENLHIQLLLFQNSPYNFVLPVKKDLPVLLPDLQFAGKEKGRFAFARYIPVFSVLLVDDINLTELKDNFEKREIKSKAIKIPSKKINDQTFHDSRYGIYRNTKVVDLHIDALLKDYKNLNNAEVLDFQLNYFRKEMDYAIMNHFHSIIFIHGVGEGTLRKMLLVELADYDGLKPVNASFEKYGSGAIEIIF